MKPEFIVIALFVLVMTVVLWRTPKPIYYQIDDFLTPEEL
jgi:hypothetical protein